MKNIPMIVILILGLWIIYASRDDMHYEQHNIEIRHSLDAAVANGFGAGAAAVALLFLLLNVFVYRR